MIETIFIESAIKRFSEYKSLGEKTIDQLSDEQLFVQPNDASNSIALIIQHLHGNMLSRWTNFLTEDGEKPWRQRDAEFEIGTTSKDELMRLWQEGWSVVLNTLQSLTPADLTKTITIRTQPLGVVDAINRQLAHYCYHVGQMVFLGKWFKNEAWSSLSIAKGASKQYNQQLQEGSRH